METKLSLFHSPPRMSSCSRFCVPRILATVIGTATFLTLAMSTVFTVLDAIAWSNAPSTFRTAATAASVFAVLAILSLFLAFTSGTCSWEVKRLPNILFWQLAPAWCMCIAMVAIGLTAWSSTLKQQNEAFLANRSPSVWTAPASAEYAVWASAMVFQFAFYSILLLARIRTCASRAHSAPSSPRSLRAARDPKSISATTGDTESTLPLSLGTIQTRTARSSFGQSSPRSPLSPTYSCHSSHSPRRSWRESLQQAVRPMTSKTKLIRANGSCAASDARSFGSTSPRHSDAFDAWDTSDVDPGFKEAVIHGGSTVSRTHASQRGTAPQTRGATSLPTIPGSRPISQADLLDSPCNAEAAEKSESTGCPETVDPISTSESKKSSPKQSQTAAVPYPLTTTDLPPPPPPIRTSSRSASPALHSSPMDTPTDPYDFSDLPLPDESFIHPLFRSESPTPPPRAHPGTSITGSPFAGAIIPAPARAPSRMRSESPSPSVLCDTPSAIAAHASSTTSLPLSRLAHSPSADSIQTLRQVASFDRGAVGSPLDAAETRVGRSRSASRASNFSVTTHDSAAWTGSGNHAWRPGSRAGSVGPRAIVGVGLPNPPSIGKKLSCETFRGAATATATATAAGAKTTGSPTPASSTASRKARGRSTSPPKGKARQGEEGKSERRGPGNCSASRPGSVRTQRSVREADGNAPIPSFVLAARDEKMG